jgi:peptide/nickel transport system substrate-binding protein
MVRNDNYWGDKPLLDGIKYIFIMDALTAEMSFENGDGDRLYLISRGNELAKYFEPKGYPIAWADSGLQNMVVPSSKIANSPWAKKEVRQALDYAIDREQICKAIGNGYWTPQYSMHVYSQPTDFKARTFDPAKAKQLLAAAGYPNGFKTTMYVGTQFAGPAITSIQGYLKDVGITVEIQQITPQKWVELEQGPVGWGDGLMFSGGGSTGIKDWPTFTNYMYINMNSGGGRWNMTIERPADIEAMGKAFLSLTDEAKALPAAQQIDAAVYDFAMFTPLWVSKDCFILQKSVQDYKKWTSPNFNFTGCWLKK